MRIEVLVGFEQDLLGRLDAVVSKRLEDWYASGKADAVGRPVKRRKPTDEEWAEARRMAEEDGSSKRANAYLAKVTELPRSERVKPSRRALVVEAVEAWLDQLGKK